MNLRFILKTTVKLPSLIQFISNPIKKVGVNAFDAFQL